MISAKQCSDAADLLVDREELADKIARMRKAKRLRLQYLPNTVESERFGWIDGPEFDVSAKMLKLLLDGPLAEIAAIDAQLRTLGVEPPKDEPAADGEAA